ADLDPQPLVEHDPHLIAELVVVLGGLLPGLDRDDPHRGGLVEGVGGDLAPGLLDDHRRVLLRPLELLTPRARSCLPPPASARPRAILPSPCPPWRRPTPCSRACRPRGRRP